MTEDRRRRMRWRRVPYDPADLEPTRSPRRLLVSGGACLLLIALLILAVQRMPPRCGCQQAPTPDDVRR